MAQKNQGQQDRQRQNQGQQPKDPNAPKGGVKQPGQEPQQGEIDQDQMGRRDKMGQQQGGKREEDVTDVEREIASDEDVIEEDERITQRNPAQGSDVERDR